MTKPNPRPLALLLLLCALPLGAQPPAVSPSQQQQQQRDRRAPATSATPTPRTTAAPQATPTPEQPASPRAMPQVSPTPQTSPTPQATPTPQPTPGPQTLEDLRARVAQLLASPALAPALFAVKVVSLDTGVTVFEENAGKLLVPASNMKIYTVATALDRLGPDFRFVTSVYADARPDEKGRLKGDLVVYGRGDPSFATRFAGEGDYFKGVEELAARIAAAGVKKIDGDIVGDESYFDGPALGYGWEWDDLQWYYGAPISALTVNDNAIDLIIKPNSIGGAPASVTIGPSFIGFPEIYGGTPADIRAEDRPSPIVIYNRATTSPRGTRRAVSVSRPLGRSYVEVEGTIPAGDEGQTVSVTVERPALLFATMMKTALARRGVAVRGRARSLDAREREIRRQPFDASRLVEIARRESPPFREIAAQTMKPSQNLYTELILRALGERFPPAPDPNRPDAAPLTSAPAGHTVVRQFLREAGVQNVERLSFVDGSGLARQNLITADATVQLLTHMSRHRHFQIWLDAQPVAGVDGTLRGRMRGTSAAGNLRAKTGTVSNVSALSGYVTTAAGERLVFSIMANHYTDAPGVPPRTNFLDGVATLLASFAGRSQ